MTKGLLLNIVGSILKNLGLEALNEASSAWDFKAELSKLENTMRIIRSVLLDAEERQLESHVFRDWLHRLKEVVYRADDLIDEAATIASRKQARGESKLTKEVKTFLSDSNPIAFAFSISQKIKKIREELDRIGKDTLQFGLDQRSIFPPMRRNEIGSFVNVQKIIGRDADKETILGMLDQYPDQQISVVAIVGMGGLGKTALAKLVYNDDKVKQLFDLRLWVYVSEIFDVKRIVINILDPATKTDARHLNLEQLQEKVRQRIIGKKYLLVLDDVWNQDSERWLRLRDLLSMGREGSKILVTTRSRRVASIMRASSNLYELQGLTKYDSWRLFEMVAFRNGMESKNPTLLNIGKEIVEKCGHVPLAIRALGALLYGQDESKWLYIKGNIDAYIWEDRSNVINILKLSYDQLRPSLQSCFAYCALFPKDYKFEKENLISHWMAQGLIVPMDESQSLEEVGEEYFLALLDECFFQEITRNAWGDIKSCEMHNLIHDLAIRVAGMECKVVKQGDTDFDKGIHHVSFGYSLTSSWEVPGELLKLPLLRTFLLLEKIRDGPSINKLTCGQLFSSNRTLRVLDLHDLGVDSLPDSIGRLLHLRYINLSGTFIEALPNSITELRNLQTLELQSCQRLKRLPTDIDKLVNLRGLNVSGCCSLTCMPSGIGLLTSLHSMPFILVNSQSSRYSRQKTYVAAAAQLCDLKNLNNLKGSLEIEIKGKVKDSAYEAKEANLRSKDALRELHILMVGMLGEEGSDIHKHDEAVLEGLQPHPNLKKLQLSWYRGKKLPAWAMNDNLCATLPSLVEIELGHCETCLQLPSFSKLRFLKYVSLEVLISVEYIESSVSILPSSPAEELFFPSLEELRLHDMPNLKGWWREIEAAADNDQIGSRFEVAKPHQSVKSFPNLLRLTINKCPHLKSMPHCPKLGNLTLLHVNDTLSMFKMTTSAATSVGSCSTSAGSSSGLKTLNIGDVEALVSLPKESLSQLTTLKVHDTKLFHVSRLEELFKSLNSLSCLEFSQCSNLSSIYGGLEHLTALEKLVFSNCYRLDLSPSQDVEDSMPWGAMSNLQYLQLTNLNKLVGLPNGLQHLTNLRCLHLERDYNLEALPEWISCLSSLQELRLRDCLKLASLPEGIRKLTELKELRISNCGGLTKICDRETGNDWPKIQHIKCVIIED